MRKRDRLNESMVKKIKSQTIEKIEQEVDAITVDPSGIIANLINKRCKEHPKILKFDEEKQRNVYVRDPQTNEPLIDESVTVYKLYYNLYPIIGNQIGLMLDTSYSGGFDPYRNYKDSMKIDLKESKKGALLTVKISKAEDSNSYGKVWKKISEIVVPENLVVVLKGMEKYNEFADPRLVQLYAKLLGGIFMSYGDTVSKKKDYKDNPTDYNLANINRGILPKDFDVIKVNQKLSDYLNESKNDSYKPSGLNLLEIYKKYKSIVESMVGKIKRSSSNDLDLQADEMIQIFDLDEIYDDLVYAAQNFELQGVEITDYDAERVIDYIKQLHLSKEDAITEVLKGIENCLKDSSWDEWDEEMDESMVSKIKGNSSSDIENDADSFIQPLSENDIIKYCMRYGEESFEGLNRRYYYIDFSEEDEEINKGVYVITVIYNEMSGLLEDIEIEFKNRPKNISYKKCSPSEKIIISKLLFDTFGDINNRFNESIVGKVKGNSFKDLDSDVDSNIQNPNEILTQYIIDNGFTEYDDGAGEIEIDLELSTNQICFIQKDVHFDNVNSWNSDDGRNLTGDGPYKFRLFIEDGEPSHIGCFMYPLKKELIRVGWGENDWSENLDLRFDEDFSKQEQIEILKKIGAI